VCAARVGGGT